MNTQRRPGLHAGMTPRLARQRTSSGCIFRNAAASSSVSVFIKVVEFGQVAQSRPIEWRLRAKQQSGTTLGLVSTTIRDDFLRRFVGSFSGTYALCPSHAPSS